jgi:hypothetical protein
VRALVAQVPVARAVAVPGVVVPAAEAAGAVGAGAGPVAVVAQAGERCSFDASPEDE